MDGIKICCDSLLLVFREELHEIAHIHESHVQFVRSLRNDSPLAFYLYCHLLLVLSPGRRRYPPFLEHIYVPFLYITSLMSHLD